MVDIEELKKKKMEELMQQQQIEQQRLAQEGQLKEELKKAMAQILTPKARERLANIRASKPEFAQQVELTLIQLAQSGQIKTPIHDNELKTILYQLMPKKDFNIRRK